MIGSHIIIDSPSALDVVRAAQAGEVESLALLLTRERAPMLAVALGVLGAGPDAEDAVQDAMLVALQRIGELRDPQAAGPWLRMIVRNICRAQLRARTPVPVGDPAALLPLIEPEAAHGLEQHDLRDWLWHGLEDLSEPLRLVIMLRYFTAVTSYEQISALCAIPVGTVRSRLNAGRAQLLRNLLACAPLDHDDIEARTSTWRREAEETLSATRRGAFAEAFARRWNPVTEVTWPDGRRTRGTDDHVRLIERNILAGMQQRLTNVVAGREIVIWEADLVSPPDDPFHCPPGAVWLYHLRHGQFARARLFHAPRPAMTARP